MRYGIILIGILVIAAIVRLAYINYAGGSMVLEPDSQGYYSAGNFFTDDLLHNFFNTNRTPGYTMLTSLALSATTKSHPPYQSPQFYSGIWIILLVQTIFGLIGLIILYDTLAAIGVPPVWNLAFTALTAVNLYQFIWERAFLTEEPYIFLFIILMRLFVSLMKKPTVKIGLLFTFLAVWAFEIRPTGLLVPFILLPIVWLMHRTKKVFFLMAALLLFYCAVPLAHMEMNKELYNFKGLSINTDFAIFGRMLHYNLPVDAAKHVEPLYSEVIRYRTSGGNISIPWYFFVANNNEVYSHMDNLQKFDSLVLKDQLPAFTGTLVGDIPIAFSDTYMEEVLYRAPTPSVARSFFDTLNFLITALQQTTIVVLILFPFSVWLFIKKQSIMHAFILAIGLLEMYQLAATLIYGGAWEYARHMITMQTYVFFFCFWFAAACYNTFLCKKRSL